MKILVIGDPHGFYRYKKFIFKDVDLILVTGDLGVATVARKWHFDNIKRKQKGLLELEKDSKFIKKVHMEIHDSTLKVVRILSKYAPTYSLQGNVEILTISQVKEDKKKYGFKIPITREVIDKMKNFHLAKNIIRNIDGLRIGFLEYFIDTSWVRDFSPGDYGKKMKGAMEETSNAKKILKRFGKVDILVCHQPPYGILDKVGKKYNPPKKWIGLHAGSKTILDYIKKYQPKYVLCGHIHEAKGRENIGKTTVINAGCCGNYVVLDI
ncbi:MAG: metallophosphoesterase [Nanoarchaeota archaeon]|nr:metallophosphoesterase [Nanoarchaeota archaeon]MBU1027651.1 metallophosphoesterase [Nanoarchaeota archaeon]